jgi:hypothetical protein
MALRRIVIRTLNGSSHQIDLPHSSPDHMTMLDMRRVPGLHPDVRSCQSTSRPADPGSHAHHPSWGAAIRVLATASRQPGGRQGRLKRCRGRRHSRRRGRRWTRSLATATPPLLLQPRYGPLNFPNFPTRGGCHRACTHCWCDIAYALH